MAHDNQPIVISARDINQLPPESLFMELRAVQQNGFYSVLPIDISEDEQGFTQNSSSDTTELNAVRDMKPGDGSVAFGNLSYLSGEGEGGFDKFLKEKLGDEGDKADARESNFLKLMQREFREYPLLVVISYVQRIRSWTQLLVGEPAAFLTGWRYKVCDETEGRTAVSCSTKTIESSAGEKYELLTVTCHNLGFLSSKKDGSRDVKVLQGEVNCHFILTPFGPRFIDVHYSNPLLHKLATYSEDLPADSKQVLLDEFMDALNPIKDVEPVKLLSVQPEVKVEVVSASAADKGKGKQKEETYPLEAALSSAERRILNTMGRLEPALIQNKNYRFAYEYAYRHFLQLLRSHQKEFTNNTAAVDILAKGLDSLAQFIEDPTVPIQDVTLDGLPESAKLLMASFNFLKQAILLAQNPEHMRNAAALLDTIVLKNPYNLRYMTSLAEILGYLRTQPSLVDQFRELGAQNLFGLAEGLGRTLTQSLQPNVPLEITVAIARNKLADEASKARSAEVKNTKQEQVKLCEDVLAVIRSVRARAGVERVSLEKVPLDSLLNQLRKLGDQGLFELAESYGKFLQESLQPNVPLEITFAIARNKAALEASTATTADHKKTKQEQTKLFDDMVVAMDRFGAAARPSNDELLEYLYKLSSHGLDASVQDWKIFLREKQVSVTRDEINFAQTKGDLIHAAKQTKQDLIQRTAEHVAVIFTQIFTDQTSTAATKTNLIQLMQSLSATIADPFKKENGKTSLEKTRELAYQLPGTPSTRRKVIGAVGALCGVVVLTTCVALILSAVVASSGAGAIGVPFLIPPLLWIISAIKLTAASAVLVSSAAAGAGVVAAVGSPLSLYYGTRKRGICKEANDFTNQVKEMHEQRDRAHSRLCC